MQSVSFERRDAWDEMRVNRVSVCARLQILLLKQKLREYEERKIQAPAFNPISSQKREEFEK